MFFASCKIFKHSTFVALVSVLVFSCKPDDNTNNTKTTKPRFGYVNTGTTTSNCTYNDIKDIVIDSLHRSAALDINSDGVTDLTFATDLDWLPTHQSSYASVTPSNNTYIATSGFDQTFYLATPLSKNTLINDTTHWLNDKLMMLYGYTNGISGNSKNGLWLNATDKYLGVKIISGSKTIYAWLRMDVFVHPKNGVTNCLVKDLAWGE